MGRLLSLVNAIDFSLFFFVWSQHIVEFPHFHAAEGIMSLVDPTLRALYDLKVGGKLFIG